MIGLAEGDVLVLDLDGTLVDLAVDWGLVRVQLERLSREHGLPEGGPGIRALMEGARVPGRERALAAIEAALTAAEVEGARRCQRNDALVEWIEREAADTPASVLSLNSRDAVATALRASDLAERIAHVVGREDVRNGKPDPGGLLLLAQRHGVHPERMLLVGDSEGDRLCAERAGARFVDVAEIGVRWRR